MQEVKEEVGALKNGKTAGLDKVESKMIKNGGDWVGNWLRRL